MINLERLERQLADHAKWDKAWLSTTQEYQGLTEEDIQAFFKKCGVVSQSEIEDKSKKEVEVL